MLRFAIGYAEDGYPVLPQIASAIRNVEPLFRDEWTTSADVYLPVLEPGTLHRTRSSRRRTGGSSTESKTRSGRSRSTAGTAASSPRRSSRFQEREWMDSSGERHRGLLAEDDLRDWRADDRAAARGRLRTG